jgi:hypothetical protein
MALHFGSRVRELRSVRRLRITTLGRDTTLFRKLLTPLRFDRLLLVIQNLMWLLLQAKSVGLDPLSDPRSRG